MPDSSQKNKPIDNSKNPPVAGAGDDDKQSFSANKNLPVVPISGHKEQEPSNSPETLIKEIQEKSKQADLHAEKEVQKAIGKEAKLSQPEIEIPPDLEDHGVKSPEKEASKVVSSVDLPMTEDKYESRKETKIKSHVSKKLEVFGVSSVVALAMLVGRMIKLAHHHAKKAVFSRSSTNKIDHEKKK